MKPFTYVARSQHLLKWINAWHLVVFRELQISMQSTQSYRLGFRFANYQRTILEISAGPYQIVSRVAASAVSQTNVDTPSVSNLNKNFRKIHRKNWNKEDSSKEDVDISLKMSVSREISIYPWKLWNLPKFLRGKRKLWNMLPPPPPPPPPPPSGRVDSRYFCKPEVPTLYRVLHSNAYHVWSTPFVKRCTWSWSQNKVNTKNLEEDGNIVYCTFDFNRLPGL